MSYSMENKVDQTTLKKVKEVIVNVLNLTCDDEKVIEVILKLEEKGLKLMKYEPGD